MSEEITCPKCKEVVKPTYPREPYLPVYICCGEYIETKKE